MKKIKDDKHLVKRFNHGSVMICLVGIASILGLMFREFGFPETNIVMIYLLAVVVSSWLIEGFLFGMLASFLSTLMFNFLFTVPYYTLSVDDPNYIITFIIMTITAVITSTLTSHAKKSALEALQKEAETNAVFNLTSDLTDKYLLEEIVNVTVRIVSNHFNCQAGLFCFSRNGNPESVFTQQLSNGEMIHREIHSEDLHILEQHKFTEIDYQDREFHNWPIKGRDRMLGVLRIPLDRNLSLTDSEKRLLASMIESVGLAMDRFWSFEAKYQERERTKRERYRSMLLRSISHDLRTPLSGIMGSVEMLRDMTERQDQRYQIIDNVYADVNWLHGTVENIMNLTRLQDGEFGVNKAWEVAEEVVGSAVARIEKRLANYQLIVNVPDEILLIPMDARLIEQVLINVLDNAIKHTPQNKELKIDVYKDTAKNQATFVLKDEGTGIPNQDLPYIFEMFHTAETIETHKKSGIGLGLAICKTIINAHEGSITASNRTDKQGAVITFSLPLGGVTRE